MSFIYLASPYSHKDPAIQQQRFELAEMYAARKITEGVPIYSPIVHCHEMAKKHRMPDSSEAWREYNFSMLCKASALWVLKIPGHKESDGVRDEIEFARQCGILVTYVDMEDV